MQFLLNIKGIIKNHAAPITLSALHFAWVLSFPMWGPSLLSLSVELGIEVSTIGTMFQVSSAAGLILMAIFYVSAKAFANAFLATLICIATSSLLLFTTEAYWHIFMALAGLSSAMVIVSWVILFTQTVPKNLRGKVMAITITFANTLLLIIIIANNYLSPTLMVLLSLVPLILSLPACKKANMVAEESIQAKDTEEKYNIPPVSLFIFIFVFYASAGLFMDIVYSGVGLTYPVFSMYYRLVPYIIAIILAGYEADKIGRKELPIKAYTLLGLGIATVLLIKTPPLTYLLSTILILAAFGYADLFLWVYLGDRVKKPKTAVLSYGLGIGISLLGIGTGGIISEALYDTNLYISEATLIAIQVSLLFITLLALFRTVEEISHESYNTALKNGTQKNSAEQTNGGDINAKQGILDGLNKGLTPRESQILSLLVDGLSNQEISNKLSIAAPTVRTHLRNIYRKTGMQNRHSLLSYILSQTSIDEEGNRVKPD